MGVRPRFLRTVRTGKGLRGRPRRLAPTSAAGWSGRL